MTTAERIAELQAQPGWKKCLYRDLGGDAADLLWCAERIAKLEGALREIMDCKYDSRIEETPWIAEEALKR